MSEHDWNVVMLNNSLLHGMVYDPESKTLQPAREPGKFKITQESRDNGCSIAFKLKRTHPDRYCSPAGITLTSVRNTVGITGEVRPLPHDRFFRGLTSFHLHKFLAPAFEIADDSSVTFTSVRNPLQMSMIQNSFSSWSVEASA